MSLPPFESVVTTYGPMVLRVCRAVVGPDDADDAWSETFFAALRAYPQLPGDANVEAWLVTIAHRKAVDQHRARARRATPVAEPAAVRDRSAAMPGADPGDTHAADVAVLLGHIRGLPERQRLALAYHHLGGRPYREIADLIGGTPEAARRAAADGLAALRRRLAAPQPRKGDAS